jgi:hypothetical protein
MADIVGGLFGVTPQSLMQQQQQGINAEALQYAQLDPFQRATAGFYKAGAQIPGAVAGMMGVQDPQLAAATTAQKLAGQFDTSTAEGLQGLSRALLQAGQQTGNPLLANFANMTNEKARSLVAEQAKLGLVEAQTQEALRKNAPKTPDAVVVAETTARLQQIIREAPEGSPIIQQAQDTLDALQKDKIQITEIGTGDPNLIQRVLVNTTKPNSPPIPIGAPYSRFTQQGTRISIDNKGETEFIKELGKLDAKKVNDTMTLRDTAIGSLNTFNALAQLNNQELVSGTLASGRVGTLNFLDSLGLTSAKDKSKLAASENYIKLSKDAVLQTLGGKLGAGFSNDDRDFIKKLVPQLENSPIARRQLITFMQSKYKGIADEATRLETYARQNKSLSGFESKTPLVIQAVGTQTMTLEEVNKRLRDAGINPDTGKPFAK